MPHRSTVRAATTVGIEMGKNTLLTWSASIRWVPSYCESGSRGRITSRLANSYLIGIEAGMATHYVAGELAALGHGRKAGSVGICEAVSAGTQE
jgi:transposase